MNTNPRRQFLKMGATTASVFALSAPLAKAFAASCGLTPPQTSGPFYPGESQFHPETDLTTIPGHTVKAKGQVAYLSGKVVDQHCRPVQGVVVEIWQACASGKYNHRNDDNPAPLDPNFKYWAETSTDANGEYAFKTVIPGAYPADKDWTRPPHIHFKVSRLGYNELITQMYFKGEVLNASDLILKRLSPSEISKVVVDFLPSPVGLEPGSVSGVFDITLKSIR